MRNNRFKLLALMLSLALTAAAQPIGGTWSGTLDVMGSKLKIVFHFDGDKCTLDSPDQNAKGLPATVTYNDGDSVAVAMPMLGADYKGRLHDGVIHGRFTQRGMVFGLNLREGGFEAPARPQTPVPPYPYDTRDLSFTNPADGATLTGTLVTPRAVADPPLVVMVSGSGSQNRDEELFDHKPFAVIADRLARNGIASFRYDDRGVGGSTGARPDLTTLDLRDDALSAVKMLREKGASSRIGILGHSEGGLIAFMIAGEYGADVDFIVSLAGTAVKGEEVLASQMRALAMKANQPLSEEAIAMNIKAAKEQPWFAFFLDYDPAAVIKNISCPVFAANGSLDVQVDATTNIGALRDNLPANDVDRIAVYDGLNHLFQHAVTGNVDEYGRIEETISEQLLADIAAWINGLPAAK